MAVREDADLVAGDRSAACLLRPRRTRRKPAVPALPVHRRRLRGAQRSVDGRERALHPGVVPVVGDQLHPEFQARVNGGVNRAVPIRAISGWMDRATAEND